MIKWRMIRKQGILASIADMKNAYNVLVGYSKGKRALGRPRYRWEDDI
jgi:hypothetical protein